MSAEVRTGDVVSCCWGWNSLAMHDLSSGHCVGDFTFGLCLGSCRLRREPGTARAKLGPDVDFVLVLDSKTMRCGWVEARFLSVLHGTK